MAHTSSAIVSKLQRSSWRSGQPRQHTDHSIVSNVRVSCSQISQRTTFSLDAHHRQDPTDVSFSHQQPSNADATHTMSLPLHLRAYQEPTKEDLSRTFFNLPPIDALYPPSSTSNGDGSTGLVKLYSQPTGRSGGNASEQAKVLHAITSMEVNAVLSVEGKDEVYVSVLDVTAVVDVGVDDLVSQSPVVYHFFRLSWHSSHSIRNQLDSVFLFTLLDGLKGECGDCCPRDVPLTLIDLDQWQVELQSWSVCIIVADMARTSNRG